MSSFKDLRIVDNFYQTSSFFPMPTVLVGTIAENGKTNLGSYSLCFPYYIAGKDRYAMLLECRTSKDMSRPTATSTASRASSARTLSSISTRS